MLKTFILSKQFIFKNWYLIDAQTQILGRFATQITQLLLNKITKFYSPFLLPLINLIIVNTSKITLTTKKIFKKKYLNYSGYQGGLHFKTFLQLQYSNSDKILRHALKGMLPKNRLGRLVFSRLFLYKATTHRHLAQVPSFCILKA